MKLGGLTILDDVYAPIASYLRGKISGAVYIKERQVDSKEEDAVIVFQSATAEQFQQGLLRINFYVNDLEYKGSYYCNQTRCIELEKLSEGLIKALNDAKVRYWFRLSSAPHTIRIPDTDVKCHLVTIPIEFKRVTF